jgi:hypothetical protein
MSVENYLNLVTSQHRQKPKFIATITALVNPAVSIQNVFASMIEKFDVDTATGDQLDIIGQWVGVTRFINTPLTGIYFSWDGVTTTGWGYGIWQGEFDPTTGITELSDPFYRVLIQAKIAANRWDGTIPQAYLIWKEIFVNNTILIEDNQDMTMVVGIIGPPLDAVTQALLVGGYLSLKPEGVKISYYAIPVNDGPIFAWDTEGSGLDGWDIGSWATLIGA